ncbi:MAG TPA: TIGR02266 family protein, partial [Polyangiaceae bacterium]|nr:TIGR02266 family protein [Polyangiaceae bacterium]
MTVRYKSATIDEFIEHHSHDVSRGGMFIKTPSPFPPGTLLKFEVKIADDQKVMQGVGRVVWKREPPDAGEDEPSGMGVKFIKIDDGSIKVIDQLITTRGDSPGAYDSEAGEAGASLSPTAKPSEKPAAAATAPAPAAAAKLGGPIRKSTMIGLGAISTTPKAKEPEPKKEEAKADDSGGSFFPETDSEKDQPPPEDR